MCVCCARGVYARVGNVVRVRLLRARFVTMRLRFARVVFARIVWFGNAERVAHLFGMLDQAVGGLVAFRIVTCVFFKS